MMHMTFYWGKKVTLLFDSWNTHSLLGYLLTLLACFLFAAFYQYMEDRRVRFKSLASARSSPPPPVSGSAASAPLIPRFSASGPRSASWFASGLLFGVNSAMGYMLMLAVMSFNGGVFLAVVLGLTVGYLAFRSADDGVDNPCACA